MSWFIASYISSFCRSYGTIGQSSEKYFLCAFKGLFLGTTSHTAQKKRRCYRLRSNAEEPIQEVTGAELLNGSAHGIIRCGIRRAVKRTKK